MHQVLESAIKRFYAIIQVKNLVLIFHVVKLLNLRSSSKVKIVSVNKQNEVNRFNY